MTAIGRVISSISFKGGVGKSTIVSCVASGLKRASSALVVVVDLAEDSTATRLLAPQCTIGEGALTYVTSGGNVYICTSEDGAKVDIVPPGQLGDYDVKPGVLSELVDVLRNEYNFVFLDLPGVGLTHPLIREAIEISDGFLFVFTPQSVSLVLEKIRPLLLKRPYVLVLNKWVPGLPGKYEVEALGRSKWGPAAFIIEDEPAVEVAVAQGKLPCDITPRPKFAEATDKIAAFILKTFYAPR